MLTSRVGQDLIRNHISATIKADPQGTTALPVSPSEQEQKSLQRLAKRSDLQDSMREQARQEQLARSLESIDYRIMMVKRSALSSFMASAFVFPGGQVEVADFSPRWIELFDRLQIDSKRLDELNNRVKGPRPPMMTNEQSVTLGDAKNEYGVDKTILHPNIALRIAAIRETFEETG